MMSTRNETKPFIERVWDELHSAIRTGGLAQRYDFLSDDVVTDPTGKPFFEPYLPFVSTNYEPGGIVAYATAQNLAGVSAAKWHDCVGDAGRHEARLYWQKTTGAIPQPPYRQADVSHENITIQPVSDGIVPAVVGMLLWLRDGRRLERLEDVTAASAVCNFYRFSLVNKDNGATDRNASDLMEEDRHRYRDRSFDDFVVPELRILKPGVVVAFNQLFGRYTDRMTELLPKTHIVEINDPSWIKQGMRGVGSTGGSWFTRVVDEGISDAAMSFIDVYLEQIGTQYGGGKRQHTKVYLSAYLLDFATRTDLGFESTDAASMVRGSSDATRVWLLNAS